MAMKKIALIVLVVAVCMSAAMAAAPLKAAAATPAATPASDASAPVPNGSNMNAVGSLVGASVLSLLALYLH
ncbi:anther-specific protein ASG1 [Pyrus ussuriensis x Pyrus communis]|uniref:Anther-specific protein ASG1 n=1 Tax=Pyrus ussuriensis x Pyrus communis TaxID=2448454 RepID=A0A5N5HSH7_9ROSA|nr:anther-specific protein ASG1 [Pyrus ussuriensis x Pyrus communis]